VKRALGLLRHNDLSKAFVANGFSRATQSRFFRQCMFFRPDWLPVNKRKPSLFVPLKEVGRSVATQIAIDAA